VAVAAGTGGGEQGRRYSLAIQAMRIWPLGSASTQAFHVVVNRLWVRRSRPVRSRLRLVHSGSISAAAVVPGHPLGHGGDSGIGKPDQVGMVHPTCACGMVSATALRDRCPSQPSTAIESMCVWPPAAAGVAS
jgi:hypothetical protein